MSKKIIKYTLVVLLIISIGFNYYLFNITEDYMVQLGTENQRTVRAAINEIRDGDINNWIEILKENKGDVRLERHIGELRQLSSEFHGMSGEMSSIGTLIDDIINQYYELEEGMRRGANV